MNFSIECEQEEDGRWIAEIPQLPDVLCYGGSADEAIAKAEALALRVLAERLEQNESRPLEIIPDCPLERERIGQPRASGLASARRANSCAY